MHENKYLHLPVVDLDVGTVLGVVNVMEILRATAGDKGSSRYVRLVGCGCLALFPEIRCRPPHVPFLFTKAVCARQAGWR